MVAGASATGADVRVSRGVTPTGQRLVPDGATLAFFGRPFDVAVSRNDIVAVKYSHGLLFVDGRSRKVVANLPLARDRIAYLPNLGGNGMIGVAWNAAGTTIWSADGFGILRSASRRADGRFDWDARVELPGNPGVPEGIALGADGKTVYVALGRLNEVAAVDVAERRVVYTIPTGNAPFALLCAGDRLYVTNLAGRLPASGAPRADSGGVPVSVDARTGVANSGTVSVIDTRSHRPIAQIDVGLAPSAMALSKDRKRLFVADANDDAISVLDVEKNRLLATRRLALQTAFGAAPNALAVSPSGGALYVAEGGDDRVLVLDAATLSPIGEVRTGWYPDGVAFGSDGTLFVISLKGYGSRGADLRFPRRDLGFRVSVPLSSGGYNVYDYAGTLQAIAPRNAGGVPARPSDDFVDDAAPFDAAYGGAPAVPVPVRPGQRSIFKHVIFIIKENHTYDDYFGDAPQGNGDPRFCAFPRRVSPNHHALAARFGYLDNFYVNGTMSADGHQWTDEGNAVDYVERNTGSWARTYPSDGTDPLAYSPAGFIWQRVLDAGLTFRDYGEFVTSAPVLIPRSATWKQFWNDRLHATHRVSFRNAVDVAPLRPHVDERYPGFTLRISDQARADEFERELRGFERADNLPNFVLLQLGNDHTAGDEPAYPVPDAAVADNDLALGRIVEAVSRSRFWKDTAIFVVEDDAQNGLDHVDGHRTMALVISAYNRKNAVDSHFYNQTSILATVERIFALQPLTQFDADANAIVAPFSTVPDLHPYRALANEVPLDRLNPGVPKRTAMDLPRDRDPSS